MDTLYHFLVLQVPHGTPNPGESSALDFTDPFEVIVYIVIPILLVIFYFYWRNKKGRGE